MSSGSKPAVTSKPSLNPSPSVSGFVGSVPKVFSCSADRPSRSASVPGVGLVVGEKEGEVKNDPESNGLKVTELDPEGKKLKDEVGIGESKKPELVGVGVMLSVGDAVGLPEMLDVGVALAPPRTTSSLQLLKRVPVHSNKNRAIRYILKRFSSWFEFFSILVFLCSALAGFLCSRLSVFLRYFVKFTFDANLEGLSSNFRLNISTVIMKLFYHNRQRKVLVI